jgi:Conserved TM helix
MQVTLFNPILFLAQTTVPPNDFNGALRGVQSNLGTFLPSLLGAIAVFIVGMLVAAVASSLVRNLLKRTDIDNRIAASVSGQSSAQTPHVEKTAGTIVFWVIAILSVVGALSVLNLNSVSTPLSQFLGEIFAFLPRLGSAAILIAVAWLLATLTKMLVTRTARSFSLDERLSDQSQPASGESRFLLSETLGNALYWFIFLFFLPLILGVLDLQGPLQPVQNLLNDILAALPRILKAVLIGVAGWVIARIVRGIVTNLLSATGTDRLGAKFGLGRATGGRSLSWILGTVVYVLILIPAAIAALDALQIQAISTPAISMLNQILSAIPQIFTAAIILAIGYAVGKFVADLVSSILASVGFDNIFSWLGLQTRPATPDPRSSISRDPMVTVTTSRTASQIPQGSQPPTLPSSRPQPSTPSAPRTPSEIAGIVALVGIMLFATVAATNVLNFPGLSAIVTGLLLVFGRILVGLAVFAVGLYLANLAFNLITSSGGRQAELLGQAARTAIIIFVSAMALQQMGIASDIVNLAFGLLLGAIAIAVALSFGLGSREVAGEQVRRWLDSFQRSKPPYS